MSGDNRQISSILWPALESHQASFPHLTFQKNLTRTREGGCALGFTTSNPGRAEGFNPIISPDVDPIAYGLDEAKTIPQRNFEGFERCAKRFKIAMSTPGDPVGPFYKMVTSNSPQFRVIRANSSMCPHISKKLIEDDRSIMGESSAIFRSKHLGMFTEKDFLTIISKEEFEDTLSNPPEFHDGPEFISIDFSGAGSNETAIASCRGNMAKILRVWSNKKGVTEMSGIIFDYIKTLGVPDDHVFGDGGGIGAGYIDVLNSMGLKIRPLYNNSPPSNSGFLNLGSESWIMACWAIRSGRILLPGIDAETVRQLCERKMTEVRGKKALQEKTLLSKSPDRGDAITMAIFKALDFIPDESFKLITTKPIPRRSIARASIDFLRSRRVTFKR